MHVLALIPARGGSKGLPRKNLRLLGGKPLIAYPITDALASRRITRTIVSTENPEISEVARCWGAEVPFMRPPDLADDTTPDLLVFQHALRWLKEHEAYRPDLVVHLRASTPLRDPAKIDTAVQLMVDHPEADSLRSVSRPQQTPYKMWRVQGGYLEPLLLLPGVAEPFNAPRQQLPEVFWQDGYVDIVRPHVVLERGLMTGTRVLAFVVEEELIEIDYEESLQRAEVALAERAAGGVRASRLQKHPA